VRWLRLIISSGAINPGCYTICTYQNIIESSASVLSGKKSTEKFKHTDLSIYFNFAFKILKTESNNAETFVPLSRHPVAYDVRSLCFTLIAVTVQELIFRRISTHNNYAPKVNNRSVALRTTSRQQYLNSLHNKTSIFLNPTNTENASNFWY